MPERKRHRCAGCGRSLRAASLTVCPLCKALVCAACPATCPHREPQASQADYLDWWGGDFGRFTAITTDKE